jgi:hypothetical protein
MTNTNGNADPAQVFDAALDTLDRLRDLTPRPREIHIPDPLERWKRDAEKADAAREQGKQELRQREREMADAAELQAAEVEVEDSERWDSWMRSHLAAERETVLEIMGEVIGRAVTELREEAETKLAELTRQVEAERNSRRRERDAARERIKVMQASYAEKVKTLQAQLDAQRRMIELGEIRQRESKVEHERRIEREEAVASMTRVLFEEMMLRR